MCPRVGMLFAGTIGVGALASIVWTMSPRGDQALVAEFETSDDLLPPLIPGHDYLEDAADLPEEECRRSVDEMTSPDAFNGPWSRQVVRAATQGDQALAQSVQKALRAESRIADPEKSVILACLASGITLRARPGVNRPTYSWASHAIELASDFESGHFLHEAGHCGDSVMASAYTQALEPHQRPAPHPYPAIGAAKHQSAGAFASAFSLFYDRLHAVASDIRAGIRSERAEAMLRAYASAYPVGDEPLRIATHTLPLPQHIRADSPHFRAQLGKGRDGQDKVYQTETIEGFKVDPDPSFIQGLISDGKPRHYNLIGIDSARNALIFKPLDTDARFMTLFDQFSALFDQVNDGPYSTRRLVQHGENTQAVRDSERHVSVAQLFGEKSFLEQYAPELLALQERVFESFVGRVCRGGYAARGVSAPGFGTNYC